MNVWSIELFKSPSNYFPADILFASSSQFAHDNDAMDTIISRPEGASFFLFNSFVMRSSPSSSKLEKTERSKSQRRLTNEDQIKGSSTWLLTFEFLFISQTLPSRETVPIFSLPYTTLGHSLRFFRRIKPTEDRHIDAICLSGPVSFIIFFAN